MKVTVLGAGVVGATAAYYLAARGHDVTVIDRADGVALETSFANGGQLSAGGAAPWAAPGVPLQALRWLGRADAPLKWRPSADWRQWRWLIQFLRRCTKRAYDAGIVRNVTLGQLSLAELRGLRARLGLDYAAETGGILKVAKSQADLGDFAHKAARLAELGVRTRLVTAAECEAIEPALADAVRAGEVRGGLHYEDDESGDAHLFAEAIAQAARAAGARFMFATAVEGFETRGRRIVAVRTSAGPVATDHAVLCLGIGSVALAAELGIELPVYPVKGYSVTLPVAGSNRAPRVSITDEERRIVVSRLGDRLRAAGMAELAGADLTVDPRRAAAVRDALLALFPEGGNADAMTVWTGLRPMTPDGGPVLGAAGGWENLTLNTGHGTYGWTLACGSARVVADLIDGTPPPVEPNAYSLARFG